MLVQETIHIPSHVLGNVLRQVLRECARNAILIDGEGDTILSALHEPGMVINNGKSARGGGLLGLAADDGGGGAITKDGMKNGVVGVVVEGGVRRAELDAAKKSKLARVSLHVVVAHTETVHGSGATHEANQRSIHTTGKAEALDQLAVKTRAKETGRGHNHQLVDIIDRHTSLVDGVAAHLGHERHSLLTELVKSLLDRLSEHAVLVEEKSIAGKSLLRGEVRNAEVTRVDSGVAVDSLDDRNAILGESRHTASDLAGLLLGHFVGRVAGGHTDDHRVALGLRRLLGLQPNQHEHGSTDEDGGHNGAKSIHSEDHLQKMLWANEKLTE
mmetsp:Transcript_32985/g.51747  ORF Transcript_32985/g.51747 Transcript_32985/m.51747 type:complete len:329 (-) Transcript_32985:39-1025(-)